MSNNSPFDDAVSAVHGEESDEDSTSDEVLAMRTLGFDAEVETEGGEAQEEEDVDATAAAKAKRKKEMDRYFNALKENKVVFIHLDIESGGEDVGMVQLSAVAHHSSNNLQIGDAFNRYIKPYATVTANDWNPHAVAITGLHHNDRRIQEADLFEVVWTDFTTWCRRNVPPSRVGCIVAWNGKGSDCKWLFKVTEETSHQMPPRLDFFMDPMKICSEYKSCKLHERHRNTVGYGLAVIYCEVTGKDSLENEHNSLFDSLAQFEVVRDSKFKPFWGKAKSVVPIAEVWKANRERFLAQKAGKRGLRRKSVANVADSVPLA